MDESRLKVDLIGLDEPGQLIVSVAGDEADHSALRGSARHTLDPDHCHRLAARIGRLVGRANATGGLEAPALDQLTRHGALLFDEIFPADVKALLREARPGTLTLGLSESLLHIPWELLHDGRGFVTLRWAVGRQIIRSGLGKPAAARAMAVPPRVLVLADPAGDLPEAYNEGVAVRRLLESIGGPELTFLSTRIGLDDLKERLRDFDLVHFAGHVEAGGLLLRDGQFGVDAIRRLRGGLPMPRLVFLNGCGSAGAHRGAPLLELALTLLEAGVQHLVGALFDLPDTLGRDFAVAFYRQAALGRSVGEALLHARRELSEERGPGSMLWASYVLYGAPDDRYELAGADETFAPEAELAELADLIELLPLDHEVPWLEPVEATPPQLRTVTVDSPLSGRTRQLRGAFLQAAAIVAATLLLGLLALLWQHGHSPGEGRRPTQGEQSAATTGSSAGGAANGPLGPADPLADDLFLHLYARSGEPPADPQAQRNVREGGVVFSGDRLELGVTLPAPAFVYVLRIENERVDCLDPLDPARPRWLAAGPHHLPAAGPGWAVDSRAGVSTLVVAARPRPWPELEAALAYFNGLLALESAVGPSAETTLPPPTGLSQVLANQSALRLVRGYLAHEGYLAASRTFEVWE